MPKKPTESAMYPNSAMIAWDRPGDPRTGLSGTNSRSVTGTPMRARSALLDAGTGARPLREPERPLLHRHRQVEDREVQRDQHRANHDPHPDADDGLRAQRQ